MKCIVEQTNIYAQQFIDTANLPPHSRMNGWSKEAHTRDELKMFLAMIITMGLVNYPHVEDYWATYWPYSTSTFSKVLLPYPQYKHAYMHVHVKVVHTLQSY